MNKIIRLKLLAVFGQLERALVDLGQVDIEVPQQLLEPFAQGLEDLLGRELLQIVLDEKVEVLLDLREIVPAKILYNILQEEPLFVLLQQLHGLAVVLQDPVDAVLHAVELDQVLDEGLQDLVLVDHLLVLDLDSSLVLELELAVSGLLFWLLLVPALLNILEESLLVLGEEQLDVVAVLVGELDQGQKVRVELELGEESRGRPRVPEGDEALLDELVSLLCAGDDALPQGERRDLSELREDLGEPLQSNLWSNVLDQEVLLGGGLLEDLLGLLHNHQVLLIEELAAADLVLLSLVLDGLPVELLNGLLGLGNAPETDLGCVIGFLALRDVHVLLLDLWKSVLQKGLDLLPAPAGREVGRDQIESPHLAEVLHVEVPHLQL